MEISDKITDVSGCLIIGKSTMVNCNSNCKVSHDEFFHNVNPC